jgi:hypothetical protein
MRPLPIILTATRPCSDRRRAVSSGVTPVPWATPSISRSSAKTGATSATVAEIETECSTSTPERPRHGRGTYGVTEM